MLTDSRRILAIDGGGVKGVFPLAFLASIEEEVERPLWQYFDLLAGTSTGGIIALGLGLGYTAKQLLSFYEALAAQIFPGGSVWRCLRSLLVAKYDEAPLRRALEAKFGQRRLGESRVRLLIPS